MKYLTLILPIRIHLAGESSFTFPNAVHPGLKDGHTSAWGRRWRRKAQKTRKEMSEDNLSFSGPSIMWNAGACNTIISYIILPFVLTKYNWSRRDDMIKIISKYIVQEVVENIVQHSIS